MVEVQRDFAHKPLSKSVWSAMGTVSSDIERFPGNTINGTYRESYTAAMSL